MVFDLEFRSKAAVELGEVGQAAGEEDLLDLLLPLVLGLVEGEGLFDLVEQALDVQGQDRFDLGTPGSRRGGSPRSRLSASSGPTLRSLRMLSRK